MRKFVNLLKVFGVLLLFVIGTVRSSGETATSQRDMVT